MAQTTITSKGQVTIPKKIRKALKLETGDKIEVIVVDKGEAIIRPVKKKTADVYKKLHKYSEKAIDIDTMHEVIREKMKITFK